MTDITSISHAATIVAAYLGNHSVAATEIPALIGSVHLALSTVGKSTESIAPAKRTPAISVRKSIQPNAIICPECGYSGQILKRHLTTAHGLSVDEYRTRWGLALDYPVVAPNYAERRSVLAKEIGLGRR